MTGSDLEGWAGRRALAAGCLIFVLGGAVALGLFFLVRWILQHLSVTWS